MRKLQASLANIRPGIKGLPRTNALAYFTSLSVANKKSFIARNKSLSLFWCQSNKTFLFCNYQSGQNKLERLSQAKFAFKLRQTLPGIARSLNIELGTVRCFISLRTANFFSIDKHSSFFSFSIDIPVKKKSFIASTLMLLNFFVRK